MGGVGDAADGSGAGGSLFMRSFWMSNTTVAADARETIAVVGAAGIDVVSDVRVTMAAGILRHGTAAGLH